MSFQNLSLITLLHTVVVADVEDGRIQQAIIFVNLWDPVVSKSILYFLEKKYLVLCKVRMHSFEICGLKWSIKLNNKNNFMIIIKCGDCFLRILMDAILFFANFKSLLNNTFWNNIYIRLLKYLMNYYIKNY